MADQQRTIEILKAATPLSAQEAEPPAAVIAAFIDANRHGGDLRDRPVT